MVCYTVFGRSPVGVGVSRGGPRPAARCAVSAQSGEVGFTPERLVAEAEQVPATHDSLAGAANRTLPLHAYTGHDAVAAASMDERACGRPPARECLWAGAKAGLVPKMTRTARLLSHKARVPTLVSAFLPVDASLPLMSRVRRERSPS